MAVLNSEITSDKHKRAKYMALNKPGKAHLLTV